MENTNDTKPPQVFISFRGKDARERFLPLLKDGLKRSKVNVFTDEEASGVLLEHLLEEIKNSRIAVVLFSENYAESHWCLTELVQIKKCIETKKLDYVIPIFYKVRAHHVKKHSGKFGEKFLAYQESLYVEAGDEKKKRKRANSKIKRWKKALTFVARMIGVSYDKRMSDSDFVKKIVQKVNINLAQIAEKEGRYSIPQNFTITQGNVSNMYVFHVNQLNISELHFSQSLEALSLASPKLDSLSGNHKVQSVMTENGCGGQGSNSNTVQENNEEMVTESLQGEASNLTDVNHLNKMLHLSTTLEPQNLENAIIWLALHMMYEQANPALIFSNWDEFDDNSKTNIIHSAGKKAQMFRVYNRGVESRPFFSTPSFEVLTCYMLLDPKVSQESSQSISYHNNISQYHPPASLNLGSTNHQGFMPWKVVTIRSMGSSSSSSSSSVFRIPHPTNPLQFRGYKWGVDSRPFLPMNFPHLIMDGLELKVPQDYRQTINQNHLPHREMGFNYSTSDYLSDNGTDMCISVSGTYSFNKGTCDDEPSRHYLMLPSSDDAEEREDKTNCLSLLCYYFKRCFSLK